MRIVTIAITSVTYHIVKDSKHNVSLAHGWIWTLKIRRLSIRWSEQNVTVIVHVVQDSWIILLYWTLIDKGIQSLGPCRRCYWKIYGYGYWSLS
jgi:hypothetical protein